MKPEIKFALKSTLFGLGSIAIMAWGVSHLVFLSNAPPILIYLIPSIPAVTILILLLVEISLSLMRKKDAIFNKKTIYYCHECGSTIKLEEMACSNCGVENIKRKEALEKLEELEKSIENNKAKMLEWSESKKRRTLSSRKMDEAYLVLLNEQTRKVKLRKIEILQGSTLEDRIKWIKTQYHDKNRSYRDIAEEIGLDMYTVRSYIEDEMNAQKIKQDCPKCQLSRKINLSKCSWCGKDLR